MLTKKDISYLKSINKDVLLVEQQLNCFKEENVHNLSVARPASLGDGIHKFSLKEQNEFKDFFDLNSSSLSITKFIPASGLASRMFYFLRDFISNFKVSQDDLDSYLIDSRNKYFQFFVNNIEAFPFYGLIKKRLNNSNNTFDNRADFLYQFIEVLLKDPEIGMEGIAKGLLPIFIDLDGYDVTGVELHILESLILFSNSSKAKIHFTLDADQIQSFIKVENSLMNKLSVKDQNRLQIEYSFQDARTDSIALLENKSMLRDSDGEIIFRKSGHGALIENIRRFKADLIFIKTVDSIKPNDMESIDVQKFMGGLYLNRYDQVADLLVELKKQTKTCVNESLAFIRENLHTDLSEKLNQVSFKKQTIIMRDFLNRPLRVCGMIENEGKPGGGPFWIKQDDALALQIVEAVELQSSKIDLDKASFFNPVNMVCGLKDFEGEPWDLDEFIDSRRNLISIKKINSQSIKVLELPGLWNGSMAYWNSIFVQIPKTTFRSLKTINDCLE